ncbi:MAG: hypothetical protein EBS73_16500, partial [Betaproteobacteria bacterium]|nr:hypothetical protein [Betaproteobacteria bacterium]
MREAMSATAMSSSAGLTNQQILRMGQVAKTASLALGISMPDAINRLSRGITKLEPELLDELGIFTKIEPAVQAYALQMGKTASSLTDFERRQAFANAVLKEGEDKFNAISDAAANPFDKFLAQLKNVTTGGLNLINTVLGPIVDILSQSPAALAGGLALLVTTLVQRALPALGQIREQLAADKVMAQEKLAQKQQDAVKASQALGQLGATKALAEMEANAESELKIFEQKEAKLKELKKNGAAFSQKLNETLKKDIQEVTQFEVNQLKIAADARVAVAEAALKKIRGTSAKQEGKREAARGEIGAAKAEQEAVTALGATVQAEAEYSKAQKQLIDQHVEKMQMSRQYQSLVKAEQKLIVEAKRSEIVANMAYNT